MELGSKPNLPNDFIKNILPNTPEIVFPVILKEYLLKTLPNIFAPIIPAKILDNAKIVCVNSLFFNAHNPYYQFSLPLIAFEQLNKQKEV